MNQWTIMLTILAIAFGGLAYDVVTSGDAMTICQESGGSFDSCWQGIHR